MERININFSIPIGGYIYSVTFLNNLGYTKSWPASRHNHSEIEVQFIKTGKCTTLIGDTLTEIMAGSILIIAPHVYHAPVSPGPSNDFEKYSFIFSYTQSDLSKDAISAAEADIFASVFKSIDKFAIFEDCFNGANALSEVYKEYQGMRSGYYIRILSIITGIITSLARYAADEKFSSSPLPGKTLDEQRISIIESFFDYDYNSLDRTQKELADALGVSCRQMGRILKKTYNKSFREKLLQSRMEVAAGLLANTKMSISLIAIQLGYSTETGFYRTFYNYFKLTPAAFRKRIYSK